MHGTLEILASEVNFHLKIACTSPLLNHGAARRIGIAMPSPSTYTNGESFSLLPMWGGSAVEGAIALLFVDFNMRSAHTHLVNLATETVISELAPSIPNRRSDVVDLCSASHMNNDGFIHASSQYRLLRHNRNTDSLMASLIFRLYECIRGHGADICRYCGDTSPSLTRCSSCRGLSCPSCTLCRPDTGSCPSPSDSTQSCGSCGSNCGHATAAECDLICPLCQNVLQVESLPYILAKRTDIQRCDLRYRYFSKM